MNFLAKSFIWVTLSEIIYNISGYVIHAVLGRLLGPADYGRLAIIVTLTTMTIVLIGQSVPTAMSKYLSEVFERRKELIPVIKKHTLKIQAIIVGCATVIFFLLAPLLSRFLSDPSLTPLFWLSALVIPAFAAASFYFYYYTGLHRFKIQALLKTNRGLLRIVCIIGLAFFFRPRGLAVEGAILGYAVAPLLVFLIAWAIDNFKIKKEFELPPSGFRDLTQKAIESESSFDWRRLTSFAWPVTVFLIAYQLLNTIDLYLVKGILHSDTQTGLYNAAYTVGTIPYNLFYALTIILLPAVSKSTSGKNEKETKMIISQSLRFLVMFLVPACILMAIFSLPIIKIFYSSEYAPAAPVMSVYVLAEGFLTVFYVLTFILNGAGKVKIPMYASVLGLIINAFLTYFLIKTYGLMGAAAGTTVMALIIMIFALVYTYREFGYLFSALSFLRITLSAGAMVLAAWLFSSVGYYFIVWAAVLFIIYLLALSLSGEIKKEDLVFLRASFSRKK